MKSIDDFDFKQVAEVCDKLRAEYNIDIFLADFVDLFEQAVNKRSAISSAMKAGDVDKVTEKLAEYYKEKF